MKSKTARPNHRNHYRVFIGLTALLIVAAMITIPVYSARVGRLASHAATSGSKVSVTPPIAAVRSNSLRSVGRFSPAMAESIATYAADCTTPKTTFLVGETVCAQTSGVDLNFPEPGRWVDWILTGTTITIVSGSRTTTRITTNPQTFTYAPTATGVYKVEITEDDGNGGDNPQTPAVFTVTTAPPPPLATYTTSGGNCTNTQASSFNLGQTVCVKVSGLSNEEFPHRRVQFATPNGFALQRFDVADNSQQFTYTLPSTTSDTVSGETIDHVGDWTVALIDDDADIALRVGMTVHKSSLLTDRIADLQLSKFFIDTGDPPTAGENISFQVYIFNAGPDPATTVRLSDVTLPNTTFVSFTRNTFVASNNIPRSGLEHFANTTIDTNFLKFLRDPDVFDSSAMFSFMPSDTGANFNCTSPSPGAAGTTTCTADAEVVSGETASFTAVYRVNDNVTNGADISDANSATITSDTADDSTSSNTGSVDVTTSNPNPPACTITCPDNITVGTNATSGGNRGAIVTFGPEAAGTCGTGITSTPASGSFFPVGPTTVTSQTGSGASCNFVITVVDTPQPTISCPANQTAQAPSGQSEATVSTGTPTYTGSNATLSSHRSDERFVTEPYPIGTTTITWVVTDQYGTTASCNQLITVTSADTPTISCPSNKTFTAASGQCNYTATSSEIGSPTTTGPNVTVTSERSDGLALTDPFPSGLTYIEWTATNSVGTASCTQSIMVNANVSSAPTLNVPPNVTVATDSCTRIVEETELGSASASDDCGTVNVQRTGVPPGNLFPTGTTTITYTATNSVGTTTGFQTVRVNEDPNIVPTIHAPGSLTLNTGPGATTCGTFVGDATLGTATASDNCPGFVVTRSGVPAGNNFPVGTTTITYRVTDRVGNFAEDTQTVTVVDNTPPVVTPPANVTAYTGAGATSCGTTVSDATLGTASATDNCPGVSAVTRTGVPSGNFFPVGTTTVSYSATDAHGNTTTATQTVTVIDNTPPVISCPANITLEPTCPSGAIATYSTPTATDNCGVQSVTRNAGSLASGSVFPIGTTTVTHTATDIYGNTSSCSFTVTVKTPAEVVQDLINRVQAIAPPLTGQQSQGLVSKLNQALTSINSGNYTPACGKLGDFVTQVQNYINNGTLTSAQGQPLITSANKVRNTIGCTNNPCS